MKKILFLILWMCFVILVPVSESCAGSQHQAIADFMRAGDLYKQAKYSEAIDAYLKAAAEGFESGELYFNLGNAYYRDGQRGRAVLNYERAQQLIPRDRDLRFNYRYLLSRHPEITPESAGGFIGRAVGKFIEFYSLDEITLILFVLFVLLGCAGIAAFHWRWQRSTVVTVAALTAGVMILYLAGLVFKITDLRNKVVAVQKASANFEPRDGATEHFQMPEGSVVRILKEEDGWAKIQRQDKKTGWVPSENVERIRQ